MSRLNPNAPAFEPRDELAELDDIEYMVWDSENRLRNHILSFNKKKRQDFVNDMIDVYTGILNEFMGEPYSVYEQTAEEIKETIIEDFEGIEKMALLLFLDKIKEEAHIDFPRGNQTYDYIGASNFLDEKENAQKALLKSRKEKGKREAFLKSEKAKMKTEKERAKKKIREQKRRRRNLFCINEKDYYTLDEMEDIPTDELVKLHFKKKIYCLDKNSIKTILQKENIKMGYVNDKSIEFYHIALDTPFYMTKKEAEKLLRNMKNKKDHFEIIKTDKKVKKGYNKYINLYKFNITRAFKKPKLPKRKPRKKLKKPLSELKGGAKRKGRREK